MDYFPSLFECHLNFGSIVWGCSKPSILSKTEILQKKAIRRVCTFKYNSHTSEYSKKLNYLIFYDFISFSQAIFMPSYTNNKLPFSYSNMVNSVPENSRRCRDVTCNFIFPYIKYNKWHHFPTPQLVYNWNNLLVTLKSVAEPLNFRTDLKQHFFLLMKQTIPNSQLKYSHTPGHPVGYSCKLALGYCV